MNLRIASVQKSLSSAPRQPCCPHRALFQVYIIYSLQKRQASSCKMYTRKEIFAEICRFLVKLQAFFGCLTGCGGFVIILSKNPGTEPGVRAEARFLHPDGAFIQNACLRPLCAAPQRAESPGRFSGTALLLFTDATKGSAFGANTKGRPFFLGSPFGGAGASAPERARPLQTTHIRPLRHCCAMPPLPRGEARNVEIKLQEEPTGAFPG